MKTCPARSIASRHGAPLPGPTHSTAGTVHHALHAATGPGIQRHQRWLSLHAHADLAGARTLMRAVDELLNRRPIDGDAPDGRTDAKVVCSCAPGNNHACLACSRHVRLRGGSQHRCGTTSPVQRSLISSGPATCHGHDQLGREAHAGGSLARCCRLEGGDAGHRVEVWFDPQRRGVR